MALTPDRARAPRVLCIVGWGRSGSTLLDRLLGSLDGVVSVGELHQIWVGGLTEDRLCGCGETFSGCAFWRKVGEVAYGGWAALDRDRVVRLRLLLDRPYMVPALLSPLLPRPLRVQRDEYVDLLRRLYVAIAEVSGDAVVVDSSKIASHALLVRAAGLDVRLLHLVRDSRGVLYSWQKSVVRPDVGTGQATMLRYPLAAGALRYVAYNLLAQAVAAVGFRSRRLRYEDLVGRPAEVVRDVAGYAGVPTPDPVANALRNRAIAFGTDHTVDGNPMRLTQGVVPIRLDDAWRRAMPRRQRRLVTLLTAPLLLGYGYLGYGYLGGYLRGDLAGTEPNTERRVLRFPRRRSGVPRSRRPDVEGSAGSDAAVRTRAGGWGAP